MGDRECTITPDVDPAILPSSNFAPVDAGSATNNRVIRKEQPVPGPYDTTQVCLDITELAAWLNITERHVRRLISERRIPFHKIGGRIRFVPAEIRAWLDTNHRGPDAA